MGINLNDLAREVVLKEGGRKPQSIAQIKETMKWVFFELGMLSDKEIISIINRYRKRYNI